MYSFCFVQNDQGKYLLLRRSSTCKNRASDWDLPGGTADFAETALQAAEREMLEEAGLKATALEELCHFAGDYMDARHEFNYFYGLVKGVVRLSHEHESYEWVELSKMAELLTFLPHHAAARELIKIRLKSFDLDSKEVVLNS